MHNLVPPITKFLIEKRQQDRTIVNHRVSNGKYTKPRQDIQQISFYKNRIVATSPARTPTWRIFSSSPLQRSCSCCSSCKFATNACEKTRPGRRAASTAWVRGL